MSAVTRIGGHSLSGNTKKVFECVPVSEAQQLHQITANLKAMAGVTADRAIVTGCLVDLVDLGLVKRIGVDRYQRLSIADRAIDGAAAIRATAAKSDGGKPDAQVLLTQIGVEMRECASHFASRFKLMADRVDAVVELIGEREEQGAEALDKLRQLQSLLKGL